jgi:glutathione S-transferase
LLFGRGIAEQSRFLFAISKTPYEDERLGFSFGKPGDWSTIQRPEFDALKASGALDTSLGKVPFLTVDGQFKIGQSKAIERFLAGKFGMMGSNEIEAAQIDQLCESVRDVMDAFGKVRAITDAEAKTAAMTKWFAEDLPNWLKLIEKSIPAGPGPYLVGSSVSLADVAYYRLLLAKKGAFDDAEGAKAAFQGCPKIKAAVEALDQNVDLQAYIAARKDTMM